MFTVPNLVSTARILLVPLFAYLLFGRDNVTAAGWVLFVIGSTDWIDGYLARRLNQVSEFGKALDPIADRLAVGVAVLGGWAENIVPDVLAALIVARELIVSVGAGLLAWMKVKRIDVRRAGKRATAALYAAVTWFFFAEGYSLDWLGILAWVVAGIGLALAYGVLPAYFADAKRLRSRTAPVEQDSDQV